MMHVGGTTLHGKGSITGIDYTALGSTQQTLANWVPTNPDGSLNTLGDFTYTDNYYVYAHSSGLNINQTWHRTQRFSVSNNGNSFVFQPDEVVCQ